MSFMNRTEVKLILNQLKITPRKNLGQHFLINNNILHKIISLSEISKGDEILEIGPGLGVLTEILVEKAKKVITIEIDPYLCTYLKDKFFDYKNIEIIHGDILKAEIPFHNKVVSNIPYKITGPIFEKIFYKKDAPQGILILEKSITDRLFLNKNYKNISRISIGFNSFMNLISKTTVSRNCFYPIPKVDQNLVKIIPKSDLNPFLLETNTKNYFLRFIAGIMPYKNKQMVNAINLYFKSCMKQPLLKTEILKILQENKFENNKLLDFSIEDYLEICKLFYTYTK